MVSRTAVDGAESQWVENRAPRGWRPRIHLRELWNYRELAYFLALRDLQLRYRQTFFGVAWALLQPLAGVAVFSVVFGRLASVPHDGIDYPVFVYAGLAIWVLFATGIDRAAQSLVEEPDLVTKVYFPRVLAPAGAVLPGLLDLAVSLVMLAGFMLAYGVSPGTEIVLLPVWIAWAVLVTMGVGLWLSALNVQYRDVRHALAFVIQVWFFASPVVFASSVFDGAWEYVFAANPMVGVIDGFRWSLLSGPAPGTADLISLGAGLLILIGGAIYFQRFERRFADVV